MYFDLNIAHHVLRTVLNTGDDLRRVRGRTQLVRFITFSIKIIIYSTSTVKRGDSFLSLAIIFINNNLKPNIATFTKLGISVVYFTTIDHNQFK